MIEVTWTEIETLCKKVVKKLPIHPEVIVPIVRGGLVPGTIISHLLNVPAVLPIQWQTRDGMIKKNRQKKLLNLLTKNNNILFVDDLIDSGRTYREISKVVNEFNYYFEKVTVNFAFLFHNEEVKISKNVFYGELKLPEWYSFPWENK